MKTLGFFTAWIVEYEDAGVLTVWIVPQGTLNDNNSQSPYKMQGFLQYG
jgi:hypothetical protein